MWICALSDLCLKKIIWDNKSHHTLVKMQHAPPPKKKKKKKKKKKLGQNENGYTKYDNDYILFLPLSIAYI